MPLPALVQGHIICIKDRFKYVYVLLFLKFSTMLYTRKRFVQIQHANFWVIHNGLLIIGFFMLLVLPLVIPYCWCCNNGKINKTISRAENDVKELIRKFCNKDLEAEPRWTLLVFWKQSEPGILSLLSLTLFYLSCQLLLISNIFCA